MLSLPNPPLYSRSIMCTRTPFCPRNFLEATSSSCYWCPRDFSRHSLTFWRLSYSSQEITQSIFDPFNQAFSKISKSLIHHFMSSYERCRIVFFFFINHSCATQSESLLKTWERDWREKVPHTTATAYQPRRTVVVLREVYESLIVDRSRLFRRLVLLCQSG